MVLIFGGMFWEKNNLAKIQRYFALIKLPRGMWQGKL